MLSKQTKKLAYLFLAAFLLLLSACGSGDSSSNDSETISRPFVITVDTSLKYEEDSLSDTQFTISTIGSDYNYSVDCDNDDVLEASEQTSDYTCQYASPGVYTISISGDFPQLNNGDAHKILSVNQWGSYPWRTMEDAFSYASNMNVTASDIPNLTNVTSLEGMFRSATSFNADISDWDVSNVTNMRAMFSSADAFNQNIGSWDVSNVTDMSSMFYSADTFNQDIGDWDVAKVTDMPGMFSNAYAFNQDIGNWNVANVTNMRGMFANAMSFNQDIGSWDVSKVTDMAGMFIDASVFNQDISDWDVTNVTDMEIMFTYTEFFDQDLSLWNVSSDTNIDHMFYFSGLSTTNKDAILNEWSEFVLDVNVFSELLTQYSSTAEATTNNEPGTLIGSFYRGTFEPSSESHTVNAYRIIYSTLDTQGESINASGLLIFPNKDIGEQSPLLSFQHGTLFKDEGAPSSGSRTFGGLRSIATKGYIVSAADFLGYEESSQIIHPFLHADSLVSSSIDMLRASKTFLADRGIEINDQLFLAGYSEGGYATLALQKAIQETFATEFTVTASAAGAGPYDLSETARFFANQTTVESPSFVNFVIKAYDSIYQLDQIDEIYQPPYRTTINTVFDGTYSQSEIDDLLPSSPSDLYEPDFLAQLQGAETTPLTTAIALNDIYNWSPSAPTLLYHGISDEFVPYSNTQTAYDVMTANGANNLSIDNSCTSNHLSCAIYFADEATNFFSDYVEDL